MNNPGKELLGVNLRWRLAQAAEIRWWRFYLGRRDKETYMAAKRRYWRRVLHRAGVAPAPEEAVVDAGCGPAGIFLVLKEQRVEAIDPLLRTYERRLPHFNPLDYPWVRFHNIPLEAFRPPQAYQTVFCLNAINHVADLETSLDRLVSCLAPGGVLVLTVDAHRSAWLKKLFRFVPGDILHPHQHGLADYRQMIEDRHCRVVLVEKLKPGRIFDYYLMKVERCSASPDLATRDK